jgi:L-threonylcarbamoyladenylate synthase
MSGAHPDVLKWPEDLETRYAVVDRAVQVLHGGGLVIYPTDTVYGLGADPAFPHAIRRIFEVKGRPDEKAIIWLVDSLDSARAACLVDDRAEYLAEIFWPGALTLVLPRRDPPPGALPTLGVRVPGHLTALAILRGMDGPVATTSANRSGEPSARTAEDAIAAMGAEVDLIIDAGAAPGGTESTVLDLSTRPSRLVRVGAIEASEIEAALGEHVEQA